MIEEEDKFKGDVALFGQVDIEGPLNRVKIHSCEDYYLSYCQAAREAENTGDLQSANTYYFLSVLTSFSPKFDTPLQPYTSRFILSDVRGLVPTDLTCNDIHALKIIAPITNDPALRSRLYDVLWVINKDHNSCREAAEQYLLAAERLSSDNHWIYAAPCYHRALQLALKLGRDKELYKRADRALQKAAKNLTKPIQCCSLLDIVIEFHCGDPGDFGNFTAGIAKSAEENKDYYKARYYWDKAVKFFRRAKKAEQEKKAALAVAETYLKEAELREKKPLGNAFFIADKIQKGIEALRRAGENKNRICSLREKLAKFQKASLDEMQSHYIELDISEMCEKAQQHVTSDNLMDALLKLAYGRPLIVPQEATRKIIEMASNYPLTYMLTKTKLDAEGRPIASQAGVSSASENTAKALEDHAFSYCADFEWNMRAWEFIEPARMQIYNDHLPSLNDIAPIFENNPFVPPGHENIYLRGIHAGFHGDWTVALHLLIPQIENSLRYILELSGVDVSNLTADGLQPVKILAGLFDIPKLEEILGASYLFELRGHLIEKSGYDFRNRVCHGFVPESGFYSPPAVNIWWLVLRLCLNPIYCSMLQGKINDENTDNK